MPNGLASSDASASLSGSLMVSVTGQSLKLNDLSSSDFQYKQ